MPDDVGITLQERSDSMWVALSKSETKGVAVAWYLMASVAYYHWDETFIPDEDYDILCHLLLEALPNISHPHKRLCDPEALKSGTCYQLKQEEYPRMTRQACWAILHPEDPQCRKMPNY